MASWLDSSRASEITTIARSVAKAASTSGAHPQGPFAIGKVTYFTPCIEEVVGELGLERVDHPAREALPDEPDDRLESRRGSQGSAGLGMDVSPVDDRADEVELFGQQGDVAQGPEVAFGPAGLEAEPDSHVFDLRGDPPQPLLDHLGELLRIPPLGRAEVGADDPAPEGAAELHRVLERGQTLLGPVLVLDREDREIGSMDRNPDVPFVGQLAELPTPRFFPRKRGDECQLVCVVPAFDQAVEKRGVVLRLTRRQAGNAKPDLWR